MHGVVGKLACDFVDLTNFFLLDFLADIISCVEFNQDGDLLATGDKGGRVVIFQRDPAVSCSWQVYQCDGTLFTSVIYFLQSKKSNPRRGEYNVYSTFQSHEPEFDYLKSLEIEEKINKIRWLKRKNPAHFLLSTNGKWTLKFINYFGKIRENTTV